MYSECIRTDVETVHGHPSEDSDAVRFVHSVDVGRGRLPTFRTVPEASDGRRREDAYCPPERREQDRIREHVGDAVPELPCHRMSRSAT